jgi:hypothetical protein
MSISGGEAFNPLVAFYDIHGRKGEVLFFCFVPDTKRDINILYTNNKNYFQVEWIKIHGA